VRRLGRVVAIVIAAGLHLSILVFMNVGNFPLIMLAGLIPFLPPSWVHRIARMLRLPGQDRPVEIAAGAGRLRGVAAGVLALFALTVFSTSLPAYAAAPRPAPVDAVLRYANLMQKWNMFAPQPPTADGWMRIPAVLGDGTAIDLATGRAPSDTPLYADPLYSRWTKVTEWIASPMGVDYRQEYSRMYCRLRNLHLAAGESPIVSFELVYYERAIPPPGGSQAPVRVITLNSHRC